MIKAALRRARRAKKMRIKCKESRSNLPRLSIHKSIQHVYAQLFTADGSKVLASSSTLDKEVRSNLEKQSANIESAKLVGKFIALRILNNTDIRKVVFDRSGYKYHGRVKALAEAARENGLIF